MNLLKPVALLCLVLACGCAGQTRRPPAEIFLERPKTGGDANIYPCTVTISSGQTAILAGGESGLFVVEPGTYYLTAASSNPYPRTTKDSDWGPHPVEITVTSAQVIRMAVLPKYNPSTHEGGWEFRQLP